MWIDVLKELDTMFKDGFDTGVKTVIDLSI